MFINFLIDAAHGRQFDQSVTGIVIAPFLFCQITWDLPMRDVLISVAQVTRKNAMCHGQNVTFDFVV